MGDIADGNGAFTVEDCNKLVKANGDNISQADAIEQCKTVVKTCQGSSVCNVVSIWKHPSCQTDPKGRDVTYRYCTFYKYSPASAPELDAAGASYTIMRGAPIQTRPRYGMRFAFKFDMCRPGDDPKVCPCGGPSHLKARMSSEDDFKTPVAVENYFKRQAGYEIHIGGKPMTDNAVGDLYGAFSTCRDKNQKGSTGGPCLALSWKTLNGDYTHDYWPTTAEQKAITYSSAADSWTSDHKGNTYQVINVSSPILFV